MLHSLRVRNHESHTDSMFVFHPGLNVIHGTSNVGKSSALRALELAAYNEWPGGEEKKEGKHGPVRIGEKHCEVDVVAEQGSVTTKKGTGVNEWTVAKTDSKPIVMTSPGAGQLPEVAAVLGLETQDVAGVKLRLNWASQRDRHFLLDEIEGQSASPSLVAAVLDEMAGLSGCESLIRELITDKQAHEKTAKQLQEETKLLEERLLPFASLDQQLATAKQAEVKVNELEKTEQQLKLSLELFEALTGRLMQKEDAIRGLARCVDLKQVDQMYVRLHCKIENLYGVQSVYSAYDLVQRKRDELLKKKPVADKGSDALIKKLETIINQLPTFSQALTSHETLSGRVDTLSKRASQARELEEKISKELDDLLSTTDACPLTKAAWESGCKDKLKG